MVGSWRNCPLLTYLELEIYLLWRPRTTLTYNTSYILLIYRFPFALRKNLLTHQTNVVFFRNVLATVISRMRSTWRNVPRNVTFKNCLSWSHRTSWRNSGWFKIGTVFSLFCLWPVLEQFNLNWISESSQLHIKFSQVNYFINVFVGVIFF